MSQSALAEPRHARPDPDAAAPGVCDGLCVCEEEYWSTWYQVSDVHYEWNDGRLEEKPVSELETLLVQGWFMHLLDLFLAARPIATLVPADLGFRLALPGRIAIRRPDFALVRNDNPRAIGLRDASYRGIYDLCVESLSDLDRRGVRRDTQEKKGEYAAAGVPEYYILHRTPERQAFYALTEPGAYAPMVPDEGVIRSRVLPGFQFRTADLCRRPAHGTLRHDPVYAGYVFPEWRAAEEELARLRARLDAGG